MADPTWYDAAAAGISSASQIIDAVNNAKDKKKAAQLAVAQLQSNDLINRRNIEFQREANAANIASQEKINETQLAFQREVNDLMRRDARNAVSDKRADLARAGYSAASPDLTGFSAASLGAPSLDAPRVEAPHAEFDFEPNTIIGAMNAFTQNRSMQADLLVKRAQALSLNASAKGQEIDNAYKDAINSANLDTLKETLNGLVESNNLKKIEANKLVFDADLVEQNVNIAKEQVKQLKFDSEKQAQRFLMECYRNLSDYSEAISRINLNDKNASLADASAALMRIKANFAEMGINFDASGIENFVSRIVTSGVAPDIGNIVVDFVVDSIGGIFSAIGDRVTNFFSH